MRAFVASVPKSGTYLVGRFLVNLGLQDSGLHLFTNGATNYSGVPLDEGRKWPGRFSVRGSLADLLGRVPEEGFAVGHLPPKFSSQLSQFQLVFLYRDLREILISFFHWTRDSERWQTAEDRQQGWREIESEPEACVGFLQVHRANLKISILTMVPWLLEPKVNAVSFEELIGDFGSEIQLAALKRVARTCDKPLEEPLLLEAWKNACEAETLTKSGNRSCLEQAWSDEAEAIFREMGFEKWNELVHQSIEKQTGIAPAKLAVWQ